MLYGDRVITLRRSVAVPGGATNTTRGPSPPTGSEVQRDASACYRAHAALHQGFARRRTASGAEQRREDSPALRTGPPGRRTRPAAQRVRTQAGYQGPRVPAGQAIPLRLRLLARVAVAGRARAMGHRAAAHDRRVDAGRGERRTGRSGAAAGPGCGGPARVPSGCPPPACDRGACSPPACARAVCEGPARARPARERGRTGPERAPSA